MIHSESNPEVSTNAEDPSDRSGTWSTEFPSTQPAGAPPPAATNRQKRVGPYRLDSLLGTGGFGEVWLATREGELADTQLAVKLPFLNRVDVAAMRREAKIWAQVASHPNILPIFEATVYDGQVVIASEYTRGGGRIRLPFDSHGCLFNSGATDQ